MADRADGLLRAETPEPGRARARVGRPRDRGVDVAIRVATVELLAEVGYARLTMDDVAARAGVSKASLYLRWPNKVALVADALQQRAMAVPEVPDTGRLPDDMREFLRALLRTREPAARALAAVTGEIASNPELRTAWRRGMAAGFTGCLRAIVSRAIGRGELPADTDVELMALLPLAVLQSWRQEHDKGPDDSVVDRIVAQFYTPDAPR